ncbi:MAG: type I-E CRISPR-associated protein Cas7/Cse4/CasC [Thermoguttaceae bacterium]|nr:type I-E CRISPR-associated protein Cas7/Cse4/CasC [Thermoguttaceae bacterium]
MFGYSLPEYALGLARKGRPLSLINAFETPVTAGKDGGYLKKSVAKLEAHREKLETTYGLKEQILCDVGAMTTTRRRSTNFVVIIATTFGRLPKSLENYATNR